jgi:hypothetical protein
MPGARCTRGLVCKMHKRKRTRAYRSAEALRHPLRNGFTAYAALSPATNSSCHRHRRIEGFVAPGWVDIAFANLTPATGARTTRFCRTLWRRPSARRPPLTGNPPCDSVARPTLPRPPHPIPTFVTMANAPLSGQDDLVYNPRVLFCQAAYIGNLRLGTTGRQGVNP